MKTQNYYYWAFATGVILPSATAWTASPITNKTPLSSLLQLSESNESIDYGRDFPRHNNFSRLVDPHTNNLDVDLAAVNSLINERALARENKDFRSADNILNQLLARHGVIINDTDNTWKTGTKKQVKKRKKVPLPKVALVGSNGSNSGNHDYKQSSEAGPNTSTLSDEDIIALIGDRRQAQRDRDFEQADSIRRQLKVAGVYVEDGLKEWRADGLVFDTIRGKLRGFAATSPTSLGNSDYKQSPDAGPNSSSLSDEAIVALVGDRRRAQRDRNFEEADDIRHQLQVAGVYVEDGLKEWRADGNPFDTTGGKIRGHASTSPTSLVRSKYSLAFENDNDAETVTDLLAQRTKFKSGRNYEKADSIRDRLYETYNIRIDDKIGEWSMGGNFGDEDDSHWSTVSSEQSLAYTKSATSAELSSVADEEYVQARVDERMRAKRTRNYDLSDAIRDELYSRYEVTIHDKINEWSAGGDFGDDNSWTHVVPEEDELVEKKELAEVDAEFDKSFESYYADQDSQGQGDDDSPEEEISTSPSLSKEQLECLTVVQLKEKLRNSGLTVGGTKAKLVDRLLSA